jgi:hypothetical protein
MFNKVTKSNKRSKTGRNIIIAATAFVALAAGCGSSSSVTSSPTVSHSAISRPTVSNSAPRQDSGDFIKEYINRAVYGQWGREWSTLHPAEQKIVSRDAYMTCRSDDAIPAMTDITVVDKYKESISIPSVGSISATAVTVKLKMEGSEQAFTVHAVAVNGNWRWTLPTDDVATYKTGNCPA